MKKKNIIALAAAGLAALPVLAGETSEPAAGDLLQGINMFTPEEGDPAYKIIANEKYGTQWYLDAAYGYWQTSNAMPGTNMHNNFFLLHAALNQRLIKDEVNGGTWLRMELSGSWALDRSSARQDSLFTDGFANASGVHADIYGTADLVMPELALMQYFNNKRACVIAGMVNLTNYFDAVSIAYDSFSSFVNDGFVYSSVLPVWDGNLGAVVQYELDDSNYVQAAITRTGCSYRANPFRANNCDGYAVIGEWGHIFADGDATLRLMPFFQKVDIDFDDGKGEHQRTNWGLAASIEYAVNDTMTVFSRAGIAHHDHISGNSAEFSMGAHIKLIPSREDDFFGIAYGIYKGAVNNYRGYPSYLSDEDGESAGHRREQVLELMYSLQVNDYLKIVPHYQFIKNPAYRSASHESICGVQTVFSF